MESVLPALGMGLTLLIALGTSLLSFIPGGPEVVRSMVSSPVYIIPWLLLVLLILIYAWELDPRIRRKGAFLFTHFSLVLLIFAVMMSGITTRRMDLRIPVGDSVVLPRLQHRLGAPITQGYLTLTGFSMLESSSDRTRKLYYLSTVQISNQSGVKTNTIEVNHPLLLDGLRFHQVGWDYEIRAFRFFFRGQEYILGQDQEMSLRTPSGDSFRFAPAYLEGRHIYYRWETRNPKGALTSSGYFTAQELQAGHRLYKSLGLQIVQENWVYVSKLQASYKPLLFLPGAAALLYLIALLVQFAAGRKSV